MGARTSTSGVVLALAVTASLGTSVSAATYIELKVELGGVVQLPKPVTELNLFWLTAKLTRWYVDTAAREHRHGGIVHYSPPGLPVPLRGGDGVVLEVVPA